MTSLGGYTGGSKVLYRFMDKLCERGYEVYAITPTSRVRWRPNLSEIVIESAIKKDSRILSTHMIYRMVKQTAKATLARLPNVDRKAKIWQRHYRLRNLTEGLLRNWIRSEVTIATYCLTAYAAYHLMDKTVPLYYLQHYEELFFPDYEELQKLARLTYFMPLTLIAASSWLKEQIKKRTGRDAYLLFPGIDHEIFRPYCDINQKYDDCSKIMVTSYARTTLPSYGWSDSIEAMRIVFSKLGKEKLQWRVFWSNRKPSPPKGLSVEFVDAKYKDLAKLYSESHICFMTYWYQGFPIQVLEPMSCGIAVVTTGLGTEDVAIDGENSLVVPPRDPERLADAIIRLARDTTLARKLANKGVETACKFTWERATDTLERIIDQAVKNYMFKEAFSDIPDLISGKFHA